MASDFSECLLWLTRSSATALRDDHWQVAACFNAVDERWVEYVLAADGGRVEDLKGVATLPAVGPWLPLVHLRHGTSDSRLVLSLTLILARLHQEATVFAAWRYEAPEGLGEHCFWHAQPVRELRSVGVDQSTEAAPTWFPDWGPTMPLRAKDPLGLLLCMLVSIYGRRQFDQMQQDGFNDQLRFRLTDFDD